MNLLIAILTMGGLGLFFATILAVASEKLKVKEDPIVEKLVAALPGLNCGACAQAGCHDFAEKVAAQGTLDNFSCPPGGVEVQEKMSEIFGVSAGEMVKKRAVVKCGGGKDKVTERADYQGIKTCAAAGLVAGGAKACTYGCLGLGDCVVVCPFDAIMIGSDNLPHVIEEKCTACGLCVEVCPRKIIDLVPCSSRVVVACNSKDKGPAVRKACKVGCIGCMICVKQSPGAYEVKDFLAKRDYTKEDQAAELGMSKCPTKCIIKE